MTATTLTSYIHSLHLYRKFIQYEMLLPKLKTSTYLDDTRMLLRGLTKLRAIQKATREDKNCLEVEDLLNFEGPNNINSVWPNCLQMQNMLMQS